MPHSDYTVFLSPLSDFQSAMHAAGLGDKLVCLDRGDVYEFSVGEEGEGEGEGKDVGGKEGKE